MVFFFHSIFCTLRDGPGHTVFLSPTSLSKSKNIRSVIRFYFQSFLLLVYSKYCFQGKPVQELYIFKDPEKPAKEVPVVLLFSLVNRDFRNYSAPGVPRESNKEFAFSNFEYFDNRWDYGTLRFTYPELAMERLTRNIDFNIQNNLVLIKQEIMEVVIQRRNNTSEMTHL